MSATIINSLSVTSVLLLGSVLWNNMFPFAWALGESHPNDTATPQLATYADEQLGISLQYPREWRSLARQASGRYGDEDGFFQIMAMTDTSPDIVTACQLWADHRLNPYGSSPTVGAWTTVDGAPACFVWPSADQSPLVNGLPQAIAVIRSPFIAGVTIVLIGDLAHFESLTGSVRVHEPAQ
jgi:hypothetical protein